MTIVPSIQQRLAIHNRDFIPIGFYYAKWLEKLRFHLDNREEERHSSSSSSDSSRSSQRSQLSRAEDGAKIKQQRSPKRLKVDNINNSTCAPSMKPPNQEQHMRGKDYISHADRLLMQRAEREADKMTSSSAAAPRKETLNELRLKRAAILDDRADTKLGLKDKAVFQYREERRLRYFSQGGGMDEDEGAFNSQYDSEQFFLVQKLSEKGDNNNNEGHGSAEQEHR